MSYFNEIAGGPDNGHAHLVDSNIDWGQDVFFLKKWMDEHPEARPMKVAVADFIAWDILGRSRCIRRASNTRNQKVDRSPGGMRLASMHCGECKSTA